jgi:Flp pilus assembly pilin Flp
MKETLNRLQEEDGQALAEYGLIAGLIIVVCLVSVMAVGAVVARPFEDFIALTGWG